MFRFKTIAIFALTIFSFAISFGTIVEANDPTVYGTVTFADDAIPGVNWLDLAYQTHLRHQALVGPAGRIVYQWQPNSFTKDVSTYAKNKIDK